MSVKYRCLYAIAVIAVLAASGCKRKDREADRPQQVGTARPADVAAVRDALTAGMQTVALDSLAETHVGKQCVVMVRTPEGGTRIDPPPPPRGMVRIMGQVTIYKGDLESISSHHLKVRAAYPTSGNYKTVAIPRADIQSVHVGG